MDLTAISPILSVCSVERTAVHLAHLFGLRLHTVGRGAGVHDAGQEGQGIDDHQPSHQVGLLSASHSASMPPKLWPTITGLSILFCADVSGQVFADGFEERGFDARLSCETGEREHVAFVLIFVVRHGAVPGFAGRGEAGDENHGLAVAGDLDMERTAVAGVVAARRLRGEQCGQRRLG
jgi:hypothetical protein